MKKLGEFSKISNPINIEININLLNEGINSLDNHIVILDKNKNILNVIDRICDHAGGKLIVKDDLAVCPMHGWKLNLNTLMYQDSHIKKSNIDYKVRHNKLNLNDKESYLINPFKQTLSNSEVKIRYLNHATVEVSFMGVILVTDPWLFGPSFMTGWWLDKPSPDDSIEIIRNADYLYISHNHPDHLHPETLKLLDRNIKIIVGDFKSKSTEKYLKSLGFTNILVLDFNFIYELNQNFQVCIFKSGDFRDDSGLYLNLGGMEILFTVDSNFLNSNVLPKNIDLLLTSFAGGASGFPLCFDDYDLNQKLKIVKRNKLAIRSSVIGYLKSTTPKNYMPYAGMFKEKAQRDLFILNNNEKNSIYDYLEIVNNLGINFLEPKSDNVYRFINGNVDSVKLNVNYLKEDDTNYYINEFKFKFKYDSKKIISYIRNSGYKRKQILYIVPTNDDFTEIVNDIIFCDFEKQDFRIVSENDINFSTPEYRTMKMYIREEIFAAIVENYLPWEDFSIGFQMKIIRFPNTYESDFWYHFTNVYIDGIHYKYDSNCGSCNLINQNPLLNK